MMNSTVAPANLDSMVGQLDDVRRRTLSVCCVPPLLQDGMAWALLRRFLIERQEFTEAAVADAFHWLKDRWFTLPMSAMEWTVAAVVREACLDAASISRDVLREIHCDALRWLESRVREQEHVDPRLLDLFTTYHLTAVDEGRGLARWRELSREALESARSDPRELLEVSELTADLQARGWLDHSRLEPLFYRARFLYLTRRYAEAGRLLENLSNTERREWSVGVAKHLLACLVWKRYFPSKEQVEPLRYAEGLLWKSLDILRDVDDRLGQLHVRTTLGTLLVDQGRCRPALELLRLNVDDAPNEVQRALMMQMVASALLAEQLRWPRKGRVRAERLEEARHLLDNSVRTLRSHPVARGELAVALVTSSKRSQMAGDLEQAQENAEEAIGLSQVLGDRIQLGYAMNRLGWVLLGRGQQGDGEATPRAAEIFLKALELAGGPKDAIPHLRGFVRAQVQLGRFEEAEASLTRAINGLSPSVDPVSYAWLVRDKALILRRLHKTVEARVLLENARAELRDVGSAVAERMLHMPDGQPDEDTKWT